MEILSLPAVYDTAFQFRDAQSEIDFIEDCVQMYTDITVDSVVDIACGTGHYTREFARRGYQTYGVDIDEEMCFYAYSRAEAESLKMEVLCRDMTDFSLPRQCDLAVNLFDSVTYLIEKKRLLKHFVTVANVLAPGGLYIVEVGVIDYFDNHNVEEVWTERRRDFSVTATYFRDGFINPENRTFHEHCSFRAVCQEHQAFFALKLLKSALYFGEFNHIVRRAGGFVPLAYYEEFNHGAFLPKDELPWRVIVVLRKKEGS